jgi:hypothetical protein
MVKAIFDWLSASLSSAVRALAAVRRRDEGRLTEWSEVCRTFARPDRRSGAWPLCCDSLANQRIPIAVGPPDARMPRGSIALATGLN